MMYIDQQTLSEHRVAYDELAKTKTPEQCVHCGRDVLFVDETECWFSRHYGYDCPEAPASFYGMKAHEV